MIYASSGRPTAAILTNPNQVIDYTLFWIPAKSMAEARYLTAIINSNALETRLTPLMPKGQFGARHVQKHLWRLPIPEFQAENALHQRIAEAGAAAATGARRLWAERRAERASKRQSTSITVARREIRAWLAQSTEGQRVETLVERLMS